MAIRSTALTLAALLLLAGCGETGPDSRPAAGPEPTTPTAAAPPTESAAPPDLEGPPTVTLRFLDEFVDLEAWTYCYGNVCADGIPPAEPPGVGDPEEVFVEFPLPEWSFAASFRPAGDECGRVQDVPLEPVGDGRFVLRPVGRAGTYDVTLIGRGNGDLFTTFRWTTPRDGTPPTPQARLALLADHDGQVDSYGVELELTNLAGTPTRASARITVRAADGDSITFDAKRAHLGCLPEGTVYWDGPDEPGLAAAALGQGPFAYEVEVLLDGVRHVAIAAWPADEIAGNEPSVSLDFTPALPALSLR